jgi:hypothetical protein
VTQAVYKTAMTVRAGLLAAFAAALVWLPSTARTVEAAEPNAVLTIINVQCISTSSATDNSTVALFAAIGGAAAVGVTGGLPFVLTEGMLLGALAGAGTVELGSYFPGTDDDLFIRVERHGVDGNVWESPTASIGSQETRSVNHTSEFNLDDGISITLIDRDSVSGNDNLGSVLLNHRTIDRLTFADEIIVYDEDEGSIYVVSVEIDPL